MGTCVTKRMGLAVAGEAAAPDKGWTACACRTGAANPSATRMASAHKRSIFRIHVPPELVLHGIIPRAPAQGGRWDYGCSQDITHRCTISAPAGFNSPL